MQSHLKIGGIADVSAERGDDQISGGVQVVSFLNVHTNTREMGGGSWIHTRIDELVVLNYDTARGFWETQFAEIGRVAVANGRRILRKACRTSDFDESP